MEKRGDGFFFTTNTRTTRRRLCQKRRRPRFGAPNFEEGDLTKTSRRASRKATRGEIFVASVFAPATVSTFFVEIVAARATSRPVRFTGGTTTVAVLLRYHYGTTTRYCYYAVLLRYYYGTTTVLLLRYYYYAVLRSTTRYYYYAVLLRYYGTTRIQEPNEPRLRRIRKHFKKTKNGDRQNKSKRALVTTFLLSAFVSSRATCRYSSYPYVSLLPAFPHPHRAAAFVYAEGIV